MAQIQSIRVCDGAIYLIIIKIKCYTGGQEEWVTPVIVGEEQ